MGADSLVDDFKEILTANGYDVNNFSFETKIGDPPYMKYIKVINMKNNKQNIYKIKSGDIGWDIFEKDVKSGYFK